VTAAVGWLVGRIDEWVVRLPAAGSGLLLAALIGVWASRWYGNAVGLCAALIQATSVYVIMQARLGEVDMLLCLLTTLALFLVAEQPSEETWWRAFLRSIGIYLLLGLAVLAKGPIGPVLVVLTAVSYLGIQQRFRSLGFLLNPVGLAVFLALAGVWPWLVARRLPEALAIWHAEWINRGFESAGDREPRWFYVVTVPWFMLPWTPCVIAAAWRSWQQAWQGGDPRERFVWVWFLSQTVLLSLAAGKHKHYILPALPALSLLAGQGLHRCLIICRERQQPFLATRSQVAIALALSLGLLAGLGVLSTQLATEWRRPVQAATLVAVFCTLVVIWLLHKAWLRSAGCVLLGLFLAWYLLYVLWLLPSRDHRRPAIWFAHAVRAQLPAPHEVCVYGLGESPLVFYLADPVSREDSPEGLRSRLGHAGSLHIVTRRGLIQELAPIGRLRLVKAMHFPPSADTARTPQLVLVELTTGTMTGKSDHQYPGNLAHTAAAHHPED
jgi:4-amino-4-deoxy-L-arabinose transferase-like glycosyltransferase